MSGSYKNVRNCYNKNCPLYFYRFGHNPNLKGKRGMKAKFIKSMAKMRENKKSGSDRVIESVS